MIHPTKHPTAYAWITAEDVIRHALAAYYTACRNADRTTVDLSADDLHEPAEQQYLAQCVGELFAFRLMDQGYRTGLSGFDDPVHHHVRAHPEYCGYVDNSALKLSEIPTETNIHRNGYYADQTTPLPNRRPGLRDSVTALQSTAKLLTFGTVASLRALFTLDTAIAELGGTAGRPVQRPAQVPVEPA